MPRPPAVGNVNGRTYRHRTAAPTHLCALHAPETAPRRHPGPRPPGRCRSMPGAGSAKRRATVSIQRSEEHTSELQSLMRISYAVFCLKKKKHQKLIPLNVRVNNTTHIVQNPVHNA